MSTNCITFIGRTFSLAAKRALVGSRHKDMAHRSMPDAGIVIKDNCWKMRQRITAHQLYVQGAKLRSLTRLGGPPPASPMLCKHCGQGDVQYVSSDEPWCEEHLACPLCNSTYNLNDYPKENHEHIAEGE